jgi:hypothetical protein
MSSMVVEQDARTLAAPPAPRDLYRLVVLRKNGAEILVASERAPFALPCVEVPRWERLAENLIEAVRKRYGISTICLFTPERSGTSTHEESPLYQVIETREGEGAISSGMDWLPLDSISSHAFADEQDLVTIADTVRQIDDFESGKATGAFGRPGWMEELFAWVQREIEPYGLCLTGNLRQLNASTTFSLVRLETNGQAVWFKAVGEPNLREFSISIALARLFPGYVPTVIATRPAWNGWLTMEFAGAMLNEVSVPSPWERTAGTLADLQIASVGKGRELLRAGCRDLRVSSLLALVHPFIDLMSQLMKNQPKVPPHILGDEELCRLGEQIREALSAQAQIGLPDTLGHLDFNPGNILYSAAQCIFLDWAEAYVGPPFLTFQYLLEHLRQRASHADIDPQRLADSYATTWLSVLSPSQCAATQKMTPLLAVFATAAASDWNEALRSASGPFAGYLRSLTRRMQKEAAALSVNRTCD